MFQSQISVVRRLVRWIAWIVFFSLAVWFIWRGNARVEQGHYGDFRHFYWAAEAMNHGHSPYLAGEGHITEDSGEPERNGYIYPPLIAFLYMPLARLSMNAAAHWAVTINVFLLFGGILLLARGVLDALAKDPRGLKAAQADGSVSATAETSLRLIDFLNLPVLALCTALLGLDKIKSEIQMLQTNATIFFAWALAFWLLRQRPLLAGIALGIAFNVKYQVIGFLPYFLIRRQIKAFAGMVSGIALFALLPAIVVGFSTDISYVTEAFSGILRLIGVPVAGVIADVEPMSSGFNISIPAGLARVQERFGLPFSPMAVMAIIALMWVAAMMWWYRRKKVRLFPRVQAPLVAAAEYVVLMGVTLALSPQTNPRHTVLCMGVYCVGALLIFSRTLRRVLIAFALVAMGIGLSFSAGAAEGPVALLAFWWHFFGLASWMVLAAASVVLCSAVSAESESASVTNS